MSASKPYLGATIFMPHVLVLLGDRVSVSALILDGAINKKNSLSRRHPGRSSLQRVTHRMIITWKQLDRQVLGREFSWLFSISIFYVG